MNHSQAVTLASFIAFFIGCFHVAIFWLESLAWGKPITLKIFRLKADEVVASRLFAFNQGFYNLFLAIAIFLGLLLQRSTRVSEGQILVDYAIASVFGAGFVLLCSHVRMRRAALLQALPAVIYFVIRWFAK